MALEAGNWPPGGCRSSRISFPLLVVPDSTNTAAAVAGDSDPGVTVHDEAGGGDDNGISDSSRLTFDCTYQTLSAPARSDARRKTQAQGLLPSRLVQSDRRATAQEPQLFA
ncbi:uncharacterized protein Triagg1_4530 [Trichoderma aggressivum f. europaeum]|uniref:Uncharacterized protein n=1 Tax=Trichoderma aggressivum f. europaeum TaxID=173218 RepID=A0AAE1IDN7_9HYPO|nr:hypothetical protein Triagg1_4530 [Trichoderma aggressivum f. europaeum]